MGPYCGIKTAGKSSARRCGMLWRSGMALRVSRQAALPTVLLTIAARGGTVHRNAPVPPLSPVRAVVLPTRQVVPLARITEAATINFESVSPNFWFSTSLPAVSYARRNLVLRTHLQDLDGTARPFLGQSVPPEAGMKLWVGRLFDGNMVSPRSKMPRGAGARFCSRKPKSRARAKRASA